MLLKTIDRYILGNVSKNLISLTFLIIGVVWLSQSLRFLELIVNNSVGLQSYLYLVLFLIPDLFSTLFPICLLIAGIQNYQKMIADHEIAVLRSTGYSNLQIAKPFLILCIFGTAFCLVSNIFLIPESFKKFSAYQHRIRSELSASVIKPGTFNVVRGITVYVQDRSRINELKGVFIHSKESNDKNGYMIAAKEGQLKKVDDQIVLTLLNGSRQEWDQNKKMLSTCSFETFSYDLSGVVSSKQERNIKPMERSLKELLNPEFENQNESARRRMIVEGHQRILMPFLCLLNGLILMAILLYGDLRRRERKRKVLISVICASSMQVLLISFLNASVNNPSLLWGSYAILFICMIIFFILLNNPKIFSMFKGTK